MQIAFLWGPFVDVNLGRDGHAHQDVHPLRYVIKLLNGHLWVVRFNTKQRIAFENAESIVRGLRDGAIGANTNSTSIPHDSRVEGMAVV